jgi:hypothetical protein
MNEDDAQYRAGRVVVVLSQRETSELRLLFSQITHTCDVACKTLGRALPIGAEFQRFKEMTARLTASVDRINSIVG